MAEYPKRDAYFSHRFVRLLTKTAMAQVIGSNACWLLSIVVHQEDSKRYKEAVTYWNDQLQNICGFGSRGVLVRARDKAVEAGWLHYEPGGKGKVGKYWVIIPEHYKDLSDDPSDENPSEYQSKSEQDNGHDNEQETVCPSKSEHDNGQENDLSIHERTANGLQTDCKRSPSYPNPNPKETGTGTGVLSLVSQEILADPERVLDWFKKASTGKRKILEPTETNKRLIVHLAQRVLRDPKVENPAACFVDCVKKKNLKMTNAEEDAAIAAITLIERGPPKERTSKPNKSKSKEQQLKEAKQSPLWKGSE